ncbi:MAG: hypothetical protein HY000_12255 [Planctomycetes bacterium]|nr:hypothetical protein [Planctomycetota bacterium]
MFCSSPCKAARSESNPIPNAARDRHLFIKPASACASLLVTLGVLLLLTLFAPAVGRSQDPKPSADPAELKAKVAELVKKLDSAKAADREKAQQDLIKLGAAVLPQLPAEDSSNLSAEQRRRLGAVRAALGQKPGSGRKSAAASLKASRVTLVAKAITLNDAVAEIHKQTRNQIVDLREEFGQEVTNPEFEVNWSDKPFWEVMDDLAARSGVSHYLHTGERNVGLVAQPLPATPVAYAGPLRIALSQIVRRIQFENRQKECVLQLEIAWEPQLKPILFELKAQDLEVLDDQDRRIAADVKERPDEEMRGMQAPVDSTMIRTDFIVRLEQPAKGAEKIKSLRGKLEIVVPVDVQTFDFADLTKAKDVKKKAASVTVTLEQFKELDEGIWAADVILEFDGKGEEFESYQTWFYDNEAYLQRADGTRFGQNGGISLHENAPGRLGIQYRFVDAPGKIADYKLVYKTPSTIVRGLLSFELKDLELP